MVILVKNAHFHAMRLLSPLMGKTTGILLLLVQLKKLAQAGGGKSWMMCIHSDTISQCWTDLKCPTKIALCMRAHADAR